MRLVLARCAVDYQGRLGARLEPALRLILIKADGSIAIHADSGAYKPLNWMTPPCSVEESEGWFRVRNAKGELLAIELLEVVHDHRLELGDDPGLAKDGVEAELQALLAGQPHVLEPGLTLVRREYLTDIGPVDLLCRDAEGRAVAIEVKRVGEIAGVEQLVRYLERLDLDPRLRPVRGIFVATRVKPQARVFAASRDVAWCEIDPAKLREDAEADLTLF